MTFAEVVVVIDDPRWGEPTDVGILRCERRGSADVVRFSYTTRWLDDVPGAFPIDPELPLFPGEQFPGKPRELFGILRDASPDRWGRVLMERREALEARTERRRPRRLDEWDFLLGVSDAARMGGLRLREPEGARRFLDDRVIDVPPAARLRELESIAIALDAPDSEERPEYESWLRQLMAPGSSLGGARPKATFVEQDGTLWIAKFPGRQDRVDVGAWEFLAHELARRAKIGVPEARHMQLGSEHHTFAVKRFDRSRRRRRLYASAMTLLLADDRDSRSYLEIAQTLQDHGDPDAIAADLAELYRRVVFNVIVGNRDDHLRNHGFLRGSGGWRLAPAFDVNPNPDKDEHVLALDASSRAPSLAAVRKTREYYRLSAAEAARIERQVRGAFEDWQSLARTVGISRREVERLEGIIDPAIDV